MNGLLSALPFFSDKRSIVAVEPTHMDVVASARDSSELTGVARYVDNLPVVTGVGKYLEVHGSNGMSGVSKYMRNREDTSISGVSKYMANQKVLSINAPKSSSVDKYLRKQILSEKPEEVVSSVAQYMANQVVTEKSSVDNYVAKRVFEARVSANTTGVAKYQLEQEIAEKKKAAALIVERYLQEQAIIAEEKAAAEIEAAELAEREARIARSLAELDESSGDEGLTTVERYAKQKAVEDEFRVVTGVTKYLARKIAENSLKTPASSVEKYLLSQEAEAKSVPAVSSVEKYLLQKTLAEKSAPLVSGVTKYLKKKSVADINKAPVSGVSKYLARARSVIDSATTAVKSSLEGEFIPAGQETGESSVDKYIEEKNSLERETGPTGVAKYLNKRTVIEQESDVPLLVEEGLEESEVVVASNEELSGVARYLAGQASTSVEQVVESESELIMEVEQAPVVTGVEKYLQTLPAAIKEPVQLTGVEKYMGRQAVLAEEKAVANATGVERYLMAAG